MLYNIDPVLLNTYKSEPLLNGAIGYIALSKLLLALIEEEKIIAMQERKRALADSIYKDNSKEESLKLTAEDFTALFEPL